MDLKNTVENIEKRIICDYTNTQSRFDQVEDLYENIGVIGSEQRQSRDTTDQIKTKVDILETTHDITENCISQIRGDLKAISDQIRTLSNAMEFLYPLADVINFFHF